MSLEVDRRHEAPIPQPAQKEPYRHQDEKLMQSEGYPPGYNSLSAPTQQRRQKSAVIFLSTALAIMTVLAVIAAAVGGSIAVKRKHEIDGLSKRLEGLNHTCTTSLTPTPGANSATPVSTSQPSTSASSSSRTTSTSSNPSSTASSSSISTPSITDFSKFPPLSNCTDMGDTYTSTASQNKFDIHCGTDYPTDDFLGIWMFTFADCMEACASWNGFESNTQPCYAISFDHSNEQFNERMGVGNCFFKGAEKIPAHAKAPVDSGVFQFS